MLATPALQFRTENHTRSLYLAVPLDTIGEILVCLSSLLDASRHLTVIMLKYIILFTTVFCMVQSQRPWHAGTGGRLPQVLPQYIDERIAAEQAVQATSTTAQGDQISPSQGIQTTTGGQGPQGVSVPVGQGAQEIPVRQGAGIPAYGFQPMGTATNQGAQETPTYQGTQGPQRVPVPVGQGAQEIPVRQGAGIPAYGFQPMGTATSQGAQVTPTYQGTQTTTGGQGPQGVPVPVGQGAQEIPVRQGAGIPAYGFQPVGTATNQGAQETPIYQGTQGILMCPCVQGTPIINSGNTVLGNRIDAGDSAAAATASPSPLSTTINPADLPVDAHGDIDLINRIKTWPRDKQPFWYINWQAIQAHRGDANNTAQTAETQPNTRSFFAG